MVELGDRVKDRISGFTGIAVTRNEWLNRCVRIGVQSEAVSEGKITDPEYFDEMQLEVVASGVFRAGFEAPVAPNSPTGGPARPGEGKRGER